MTAVSIDSYTKDQREKAAMQALVDMAESLKEIKKELSQIRASVVAIQTGPRR